MKKEYIKLSLICQARVTKHDSYHFVACSGHDGIGGLCELGKTERKALKAERDSMAEYLAGLLKQGDSFPDWVSIKEAHNDKP